MSNRSQQYSQWTREYEENRKNGGSAVSKGAAAEAESPHQAKRRGAPFKYGGIKPERSDASLGFGSEAYSRWKAEYSKTHDPVKPKTIKPLLPGLGGEIPDIRIDKAISPLQTAITKYPMGVRAGQGIRNTTEEDKKNFRPIAQPRYETREDYRNIMKAPLGAVAGVGSAVLGDALNFVEGAINVPRALFAEEKLDNSAGNFRVMERGLASKEGAKNRIKKDLGFQEGTKGAKAVDIAVDVGANATANTLRRAVLGEYAIAGAALSGVNSKLYELSENPNVTKHEAILSAAGSGILEAATEYLPIENFEALKQIPAKNGKQLVMNVLKSAGLEFVEEAANEIGEKIWDRFALGENSDTQQNYLMKKEELLNRGFSEEEASEEATKAAFVDAAKDVLAAGGMGAASGGLSGAAASAIGTYSQGRRAQELYGGAESFRDIAEGVDTSTPEGTKVKSMAEQYAKFLEERNEDTLPLMKATYFDNAMKAHMEAVAQAQNNEQEDLPDEATQDGEIEIGHEASNNYTKIEETPENQSQNAPQKGIDTTQREAAERSGARNVLSDNAYKVSENNFVKEWAAQHYDSKGKQAFLDVWNENDSDSNFADYAKAASRIYNAGRFRLKTEEFSPSSALFTNDQIERLFKAGEEDYRSYWNKTLNKAMNGYTERVSERKGGLGIVVPSAPENLKMVAKALGEKTGLIINITDSAHYDEGALRPGAAGGYDSKGVITLDINSDNIMGTLSHELTHWMSDYSVAGNPEYINAYGEFREAALSAVARSKDISLEALENQYKTAYEKAHGKTMTRDAILEEIVADSSGTFLNDAEFIEKVVSGEYGRRNGNKILRWITAVRDALKSLITTGHLRTSASVLKNDLELYETAREKWAQALENAAEGYREKDLKTDRESVRYAIAYPEKMTQENMEKNLRSVANSEPLIEINRNQFENYKDDGDILKKKIAELFDEKGRESFNEVVGMIRLSNNGIKEDMYHDTMHTKYKFIPEKYAAYNAIHEVINNGKIIEYEHGHKAKYDTAVIAGKIKLNLGSESDGIYNMIVDVKVNDNSNTLHFHEVSLKKEENLSFSTVAIPELIRHRADDVHSNSLSINNIFELLESVKGKEAADNNIKEEETGNSLKYQLDIDDSMMPEDILKENEHLKKANTYLTNMLNASRKLTPSIKDAKRAAKSMIDEYHSSISQKELTEKIWKLYEVMRTSENLDGAEVSEVAAAIAKEVIDKATYTNEAEQKMWNNFRKEARQIRLYIPKENISDYSPEGYNALRKKYFGKINITTDPQYRENYGSAIYAKLKNNYSDYFTEDAQTITDDEAVHEILGAFEWARPRETNVYDLGGMSMDEAAYSLSQKIMDAYFEVGNDSVADTYKRTYKQFMNQIKAEIRNEYNEELRAIVLRDAKQIQELDRGYAAKEIEADVYLAKREALKDYRRQTNEALRQDWKKHREKVEDYHDRGIYKKNIMRDSQKLLKMLVTPTDKLHIPEALTRDVTEILSYIDFTSNRVNTEGEPTLRAKKAEAFKESVTSLKAIMENASSESSKKESGVYIDENGNSHYLTIDPDMVQNLHEMSKMFKDEEGLQDNIDRLTTENLRTVQDTLMSIKRMIEDADRMISMQRYTKASEVASKTVEELRKRKDAKQIIPTKAGELAQNMLDENMLDSYTYFYRMGDTGKELYRNLRHAEDRKTNLINETVNFMDKALKNAGVTTKDVRRWKHEIKTVKIGSTEIKVTPAQLMSLYLLNQRGQARMHIYGPEKSNNQQNGGIRFDATSIKGVKTKEHTFKVKELDVNLMLDNLTGQQKKIAAEIGRFLTENTSRWGNDTSMQVYGYKKFRAKNYFPIDVYDASINKGEVQISQGTITLKNMGMTKSTQQRAYNPLVIHDIFDVYTEQADKMSYYSAYLPVLEDTKKWYNYRSAEANLQEEIERAYGKGANDYMMNLLRDLNGSRGDGGKFDSMYSSLAGKAKSVMVGANFRVVVQQPTAYARAMAVMDPKYLAAGLTLSPLKQGEQWELAKKYSPIARWKEWGGYDINVGRSLQSTIFGTDGILDTVREKAMSPAEAADRLTWQRLWWAAQAQIKDQRKDLEIGSDAFYMAAADVFDEVVDATQVVDSVLHRTDVMKSKSSFAKELTAFLSEPMKTYNMLYRAVSDVQNGKEGAKAAAARVVVTHGITAALTAAVASVITAMRNHRPEEEKKFGERWTEAFVDDFIGNVNPLNAVPLMRDVISMIQGYSAGNYALEPITRAGRAIKEIQKIMKGENTGGILTEINTLLKGDVIFLGGLIANFNRDVGATIDAAISVSPEEIRYRLQYEELKLTRNINHKNNLKLFVNQAMKAYAAGDNATGDRIMEDLLERGYSEDKIENKIKEMAKKELEDVNPNELIGNPEQLEKLKKELIESGYSEEIADKAIENKQKEAMPYSWGEVGGALAEKTDNSKEMLAEMEKCYRAMGKDEKDVRSVLKRAITSQYKEEYKKHPEKRSEIMKKLYGVLYNGEQLYTVKDFDKWNKE